MKTSLFLLPLAALSLSACGYSVFDAAEDISSSDDNGLADGTAITGTAATTPAFTALEAFGPDNIVFVTGDSFQISATGDAEAMKHLRFKVKDGTIMIGRKSKKFWGNGNDGVTITVTAPRLTEASLAGSGDFTADRMAGDAVLVELAGSGNADVADVTAKSFKGDVAGTGDVRLTGKVERAEFSVAGTGDIDASKLASVDAEVSIAGTGDVRLSATGTVDASIAGTGDINVTGGAKCKSSSIGSGKINCG